MSTLPSRNDPRPSDQDRDPDTPAAIPAQHDGHNHHDDHGRTSGETGDRSRTSVVDDDRSPTGRRDAPVVDRQSVVDREKDRHGGIKWGSAFFGWLTATGTAVILTALLLAAGTAVGVATATDLTDAQNQAGQNAGKLSVAGGITLLVVLLIAYYCGGYVAGRMARFNGMKQGIAVWIWTIVITAVVALATAALGDKYNVLNRVGGFPQLPVSGDAATTGAIIALIIALAAALIGAILGGLAGMRFHRKVDRTGLGS
jgi:hypothetical protein